MFIHNARTTGAMSIHRSPLYYDEENALPETFVLRPGGSIVCASGGPDVIQHHRTHASNDSRLSSFIVRKPAATIAGGGSQTGGT